MKTTQFLCFGLLIMVLSCGLLFGQRSRTTRIPDPPVSIPPEIVKQYDPDILSGKRPSFETLRNGDIFSLRDKPKLDADFVRLALDLGNL